MKINEFLEITSTNSYRDPTFTVKTKFEKAKYTNSRDRYLRAEKVFTKYKEPYDPSNRNTPRTIDASGRGAELLYYACSGYGDKGTAYQTFYDRFFDKDGNKIAVAGNVAGNASGYGAEDIKAVYAIFDYIDSQKKAARLDDNGEEVQLSVEEKLRNSIEAFMKFFTEFGFEPNFRFLNTLSRCTSRKEALDYIVNYFELINSPYVNEVESKVKSQEFRNAYSDFSEKKTDKIVNNRFKIYYGSQGTGKTTAALKETDNNCVVCHNAMLPSDLMEDFKFSDNGNAKFVPSALYRAMTEGKKIVLDEINLLPFESLRFLQGVLDGKKNFIYKDTIITIKDGFEVIGTMNLTVNGMTYGLPEPLVDRCAQLKKFILTADDLMSSIF